MMSRGLAALAVVLALLPGMALANRLALVIGNDGYENLPILHKAQNDAAAIADLLGGYGYTVSLLRDADRRSMTKALSDLAADIDPGGEVVFYFAGHGVEISGRNYLIPIDAPAARPEEAAFLTAESIAVDQVLDTIRERGARVTVLILDACRDNPFPQEGTRSLGGSRGLAPVAAPEGTFILFSAGAGQTALDGMGGKDRELNSVFTRSLLRRLDEPGQPIQDIARLVRRDVEELAASVNHKQRPAYYDELTDDFILTDAPSRGAAPLDDPAEATSAAQPSDSPLDDMQPTARTWRVKLGVSEGHMNVREGRGTSFPILFEIREGMGGLVIGQCLPPESGTGTKDWCFVQYQGRSGWISSGGIEPE
jgi:uncharacterized caspase-like protein